MDASPVVRRFRFDPEWREVVTLRDGTPLLLRLIDARDGALVQQVFEHMSDTARYQRFLHPRRALSADEVRYLTELDQVRHLAIVALDLRGDGGANDELADGGTPVAIARYVCLPGRADVAEPAVTVIDRWHRRGVASLLLRRVALAARERGVASLRASVLATNDAMRALVRRRCQVFRSVFDGTEVVYEIPLVEQNATAA